MEEILSAALILVACISGGVSCMYIARSRSTTNKHSRQRIKDYETDIKSISEMRKSDAVEFRQEILRLKGTINKMKQGPDFTEKELQTESGIGDLLLSKFGLGKYRKFLQPYLPQIEKAIIENKDEIINTIKSNNKKTEPSTAPQTVQSL